MFGTLPGFRRSEPSGSMMPNRQPSTGIVSFFDNLIRETSLSCDRSSGFARYRSKTDRKPQQAKEPTSQQFPRHMRCGLIEATTRRSRACPAPRFPRHTCWGLIEAKPASSFAWGLARFPRPCAAAPLKRSGEGAARAGHRGFRGPCAAASLKRPACQRGAPKLAMFPQRMYCGLIEAPLETLNA
jgi:hypothetical protein